MVDSAAAVKSGMEYVPIAVAGVSEFCADEPDEASTGYQDAATAAIIKAVTERFFTFIVDGVCKIEMNGLCKNTVYCHIYYIGV